MSYKRADEILPKELIKELHKYVSGECLYIPVKHEKRVDWGLKNGSRQELDQRNRAIYALYQKGVRVTEISERYYLSDKSIYRIISKLKHLL